MEDICHKILDLYPAGAPAEAPGPSTTSAPRNPNPVPPSSTSSSIRNHPSFNAAASAANTVGSGPLSKRPRIGSSSDLTHAYSLLPAQGVPVQQPPLTQVGPAAARNVRRGAWSCPSSIIHSISTVTVESKCFSAPIWECDRSYLFSPTSGVFLLYLGPYRLLLSTRYSFIYLNFCRISQSSFSLDPPKHLMDSFV